MFNKITAIPFFALDIARLNLKTTVKAGSKAIIDGIKIKFMGIVIFTLVKYNILVLRMRVCTERPGFGHSHN